MTLSRLVFSSILVSALVAAIAANAGGRAAAETNGQPVKNLQTHFAFHDVAPAQEVTAGH